MWDALAMVLVLIAILLLLVSMYLVEYVCFNEGKCKCGSEWELSRLDPYNNRVYTCENEHQCHVTFAHVDKFSNDP